MCEPQRDLSDEGREVGASVCEQEVSMSERELLSMSDDELLALADGGEEAHPASLTPHPDPHRPHLARALTLTLTLTA